EHAGFAGDSVAVHGGLPVCGAMTAPAAAGSGAGRGQDGDEMWQFAGNPLPRPGALASLAAMSRTVAIVEDEPAIRDNYAEALRRHGYAVQAYASRAEARAAFALKLPDLVIIDVGLGDEPEGGFDLCRELRARSASLPLLFLTARDSDFDVISGLRLGADDYLSKATSLPQLTARIHALFRRLDALTGPAAAREQVFRLRGLSLEVERMRVTWNGADVALTVTEFWMVHAMVRYPGHVKSREQLMREAQVVVDDATITSHIKRIRRKFQALDPAFDEIETVHGAGYRWRA